MDKCCLCGGTQWEVVEEVPPISVVRCTCGLVFVTPQPPRQVLEHAYEEAYYRPWEKQVVLRSKMWQQRLLRVETFVSPPGRMLDVGCGTGAFLEVAEERGWDVTGTEFSAYAIKVAEARRFRVLKGEVWEAKLPAEAFDVVTCWHVIEHVADPKRVMEEIYRVLRPGGVLVLATPNVADHIFRAAYIIARRRRPVFYEPDEREVHLFNFSEQTLRALATTVHFQVVEVGFDRGAAAEWGKRVVNELAYLWYRLTRINWGMALELVCRKPDRRA